MKKFNNHFKIIFCLLYSYFITTHYRPYVYSNRINDYGIADIGNNLVFIPFVYYGYFIIFKKYLFSKYFDVFFHLTVLTSFEIISNIFDYIGTFDYKDIIGLFLGATFVIIDLEIKKNVINLQ